MVIGTSCIFSVRRWAVTVISSIVSVGAAAAVSLGGAAYVVPAADPLKIAAIAQDNFDLKFMLCIPPGQ
jgi:hypothetical protein